MSSRERRGWRESIRKLLAGLLAFGALNAFGGGAYGLAGARGIPREWLLGSPFADYFVPSVILIVAVGGTLLLAAVAVLARWPSDRRLVVGASVVVLVWVAVQVAIIGYVSMLQPITAAAGVVIMALGYRLSAAALPPQQHRPTA